MRLNARWNTLLLHNDVWQQTLANGTSRLTLGRVGECQTGLNYDRMMIPSRQRYWTIINSQVGNKYDLIMTGKSANLNKLWDVGHLVWADHVKCWSGMLSHEPPPNASGVITFDILQVVMEGCPFLLIQERFRQPQICSDTPCKSTGHLITVWTDVVLWMDDSEVCDDYEISSCLSSLNKLPSWWDWLESR